MNSGLIGAGEFGVIITTNGSDASTLTNSGTIRANMAFLGGTGQDTVINTGRIEGKLDFSLGDDLYDGRGGVVTGTVVLGNGNDTAYGGGAIETLNGGQGDDLLYGNGGDDYLDGGDGTDILNGGAGDDVMTGGAGDDTYVVDTAGDVVSEGNDAGIDTVEAAISYTLGADVENLVLTGIGNLTGAGNELANVITDNDGDNLIDGGAGADELRGGKGNDVYIVDDANDTVSERADAGTDTVRASVSMPRRKISKILSSPDFSTSSTAPATRLPTSSRAMTPTTSSTGSEGADRLIGGGGNDTYVVDHESDAVIERRRRR